MIMALGWVRQNPVITPPMAGAARDTGQWVTGGAAFSEVMNACQSARLNHSAGPCRSVESRTATLPGRSVAISTQVDPLAL